MTRTARVVIDPLIEDVATASAAYLWDVWPEIAKAPPEEAFRRLALHFETAIRAYFEALENWGIPLDE